jgi:hypothetical protein
MNARRSKTPESELGAKLRVFAGVYAGQGQEERGRAYANVADTVDQYLHAAKGGPEFREMIVMLSEVVQKLSALKDDLVRAFDAIGKVDPHPPTTSADPPRRVSTIRTPLLDVPPSGPLARAAARAKEVDEFAAKVEAAENRTLKPVDAAILSAMVQRGRSKPSTSRQLATLAGYRPSGTVTGSFARLRANGWIEGPGSALVLTEEGMIAAPPARKLPTGKALVDYWAGELPPAAGEFLRLFVDAYPKALTMDALLERTGYAPSGTVTGALAKLRLYELVDGWKASDDFMEMARVQE